MISTVVNLPWGSEKYFWISKENLLLRATFWECRESEDTHEKSIFSFISPKHTFGWTYARENSLKFQRFILRPKFKKVRNWHIMAFSRLKIFKISPALLYENSRGVKRILWKRNLAQILFHYYTLKSCNKFLEILFAAFQRRVFVQPPFESSGKEQIKANFD